ncbi:MAG: hypothetical protein AAF998_07135 [Bacteroidota bacterium]
MKVIRRFPLLLLFSLFFLPDFSSAQCPSVMGTGDPAVILLNLYGTVNGNYFSGQDEIQAGVTAGVQIGAIFSPQFQLMSGAEMDWISRTIPPVDIVSSLALTYRTFLLEIPLDMRIRIGHTKNNETHFILGAGLQLANVRETNDPAQTDDEMIYHQLLGRIGFENTITVKDAFNILWGLIGKVDPIGLADQDYSNLNGTYYAGLKLGFQFGL